MGFMGFGMQKWIYTMRPRKPFSMQRKGSFTKVPVYKREFKLQPSKNKGGYNFGIAFFLIIVAVLVFQMPKWLNQARIHHKEVIELAENRDNNAFEFLMSSGKKRVLIQNYSGAFSEFKLAKAIKPNNSEVNLLLLEVISLLCEKNEEYCKEFDDLKF